MSATIFEERIDSRQSARTPRVHREDPGRKLVKHQSTTLRRDTTARPAKRRATHESPPTPNPVRLDPQHTTAPRPHTPPTKPAPARQHATGWFGSFVDSQPLEKSFVLFGFVVAITLVAIFGSDLICGWPFQRASMAFDITNVLCGFGLAFLSWDAYKDLL